MSNLKLIYHVVDEAGVTRYVGCSSTPDRRPRQALQEARYDLALRGGCIRNPYHKWLHDSHLASKAVAVFVIGPAGDDWRAAERAEIRRLLARGYPLLNTHRGASGQP